MKADGFEIDVAVTATFAARLPGDHWNSRFFGPKMRWSALSNAAASYLPSVSQHRSERHNRPSAVPARCCSPSKVWLATSMKVEMHRSSSQPHLTSVRAMMPPVRTSVW